MLPYQIYQALMDEHVHELQAAARRHERVAELRLAAAGRTRRSSRLKKAVGHLTALAHVTLSPDIRRSAQSRSTATGSTATGSATSGPTAGPMGCVA